MCATYHLGTDVLTQRKEEKDLGIIMSHNLSWRDHIMHKVNIANRMLGIIKRTCGRRATSDAFLKLYIHLVRSHLEYACEVWSPYQAYLVDVLEGVQRMATKVIIKHKPYGERLKDLKLPSLISRRKYFDLIFLFKCRQSLCEIHLSNYLKPAGNASYKLRNTDLCYKMKYSRTNVLKFSYFHRIAKLWNDLPLNFEEI